MTATAIQGQPKKGRGKAEKTMRLIHLASAILEEIQPPTVRAMCYRLFVAGAVPSMEKKETNRASTQLVWARENGTIPWSWIVDEIREADRPGTWDNPDQIIGAAVRQCRRDNWQGHPRWVEVWSEKVTVRGKLAEALRGYGVRFRVMHGFSSATVINDVAEMTGARSLHVIYVGDHYPSGMYISESDIPSRMERHGGSITIERVAITHDDIIKNSLPFFPAKSDDTRFAWYSERYGVKAWELDARSPVILREKVTHAIRSLLDLDAWEHSLLVERAEIESKRSVFSAWKDLAVANRDLPGNKPGGHHA